MKKIIISLIALSLIPTTILAYTAIVRVKGISLGVTAEVGNIIELVPKIEEIKGWKVKSGDVAIENNKFIMPEGDVEIEGVDELKYNLVIKTPVLTQTEERTTGEEITITATNASGYEFKNWTVTGITLTEEQRLSNTIAFVMPANEVSLVANYNTITYMVSCNTNGGTITGGGSKEYNSTVTLTANPNTGYNFVNWEVLSGGVTLSSTISTTTTFTMPANDVEINANFELKTYTVSYNANGGSGVPSSQTKTHGVDLTLSSTTPTKTGYNFLGWATSSSATEAEYVSGGTYALDVGTTLYAVWEEDVGWNKPLLGSGMTPVNWNGSAWVDTTKENWEYNYETASAWSSSNTVAGDGTAMWANARTDDGSMYVWIPRFTYYVNSGNSVSWNADTAGTARTYILFSNGTTDYTTDPTGSTSYTYEVHSAFNPGEQQITGFWIGKFETSKNDATSSSVGSGTTPASKPGVISWRNETVSDMFSYAKSLNTTLGSHLLKDDEWGAVAYLTSGVGRIPYINNSSSYITGNAGNTQDASSSSGVTNAWNTIKGVRASTTHNIYGVYDMSGGAYEYTSAYYSGYINNSGISDLINSNASDGNKYVNRYTTTNPTGGSARCAWDSDWLDALELDLPVPHRGGSYSDTSTTGVFNFYADYGYSESKCGFRLTLWGKSI